MPTKKWNQNKAKQSLPCSSFLMALFLARQLSPRAVITSDVPRGVCVCGIKQHLKVRQNIDKINWKSTNSYCFLWALAQVAQVSLLIPDKSMTVATDQHKQGRSNVLVTIRFPKTMSGNITITLFDLFHQHRVWAVYRLHAIQSTLSDGLEYRFVLAKCTIINTSGIHGRRIPLKNKG